MAILPQGTGGLAFFVGLFNENVQRAVFQVLGCTRGKRLHLRTHWRRNSKNVCDRPRGRVFQGHFLTFVMANGMPFASTPIWHLLPSFP
jgi:hypothetical protein